MNGGANAGSQVHGGDWQRSKTRRNCPRAGSIWAEEGSVAGVISYPVNRQRDEARIFTSGTG